MLKRKTLILAATIVSLFFSFAVLPASAQETTDECQSPSTSYYDARYKAPEGAYDVFVKMGKRGQSAVTALHVENSDLTECQSIGSVQANGEKWQKIGAWQSVSNAPFRFQLSSPAFESLPDANRPAVMLVPAGGQICTPEANCKFSLQGQGAYIKPVGTLLNEDTLIVSRVIDPKSDKLEKVDYFSDGKLLYSTKELEPFNEKYLTGGRQTLARVMKYESKQQVVLEEEKNVSFAYDITNLINRQISSNKVGLQIIGILALIVILMTFTLISLRILHKRHLYKINHGLIQPSASNRFASLKQKLYSPGLMKRVKILMPISIIAIVSLFLVSVIDAYGFQMFRVDGISMETTLQTDDKLVINKLPKSWAVMNGNEYVPKRGQVVIFHKNKSELVLADEGAESTETYVVKRVIGLPGERVVMNNGVITVYNKENPAGFQPDKGSDWEKTYQIGTEDNIDLTLSRSEIFVIGDNRPGSIDSRANGPIELGQIEGKVMARVLPLSKRQSL